MMKTVHTELNVLISVQHEAIITKVSHAAHVNLDICTSMIMNTVQANAHMAMLHIKIHVLLNAQQDME